jgi:hypothetical protein
VPWELFGPPTDPPVEGGLPAALAAKIIAVERDCPWETAALLWDAYAAMLPPEPVALSVTTGAQSVGYGPGGGGAVGAARDRAAMLRDMCGTLVSVPLGADRPQAWPVDWWQRNLCDPP